MPDAHAIAAAAVAAFFRGEVDAALTMLPDTEMPDADRLAILLARAKIGAHLFFLDARPPDAASADAATALALAQRIGDRQGEIDARTLQGRIAYYGQLSRAQPDYSDARGHFEAVLEMAKQYGRPQQVAAAHFFVGLVQQMTRQSEAAEANFRRAYDLARECGASLEQSYAIRHIGFYQRSRGEYESALASFRESLALREAIDLRAYIPPSYLVIAETLDAAGDKSAALDAFHRAEQIAAGLGFSRLVGLVALSFGEFLAASGDAAAARAQLERALEYGRKANHEVVVTQAEEKLKEL